jgi:hypothetical protein
MQEKREVKMSEMVHVILYGSLRNNQINSPRPSDNLLAVTAATPLKNVIRQLDIPDNKVQMAMCNHRAVSKDAVVNPGDRLALFPVEYPVYPDWNDYRF